MRVSGAAGDNRAAYGAATYVPSELSTEDRAIEMARAILQASNIDRNGEIALLARLILRRFGLLARE